MSQERARGVLLGLAVGDALGTTYEFARLEQPAYPTLATGPANDVVGQGPFGLAPGQVTDDTQLAVCLARSLAACGRFDVADCARRYVAWAEHAFDIGSQTKRAIDRLAEGEPPSSAGLGVWRESERRPAGNGSLMRTAPLAVALGQDPGMIDAAIAESLITHADPRCALACAAFDAAIAAAIAEPIDAHAMIGAPEPERARRMIGAREPERARMTIDAREPERARRMIAAARGALVTGAQRLRRAWAGDNEEAKADLEHLERAAVALDGDLDAAGFDDPRVYLGDVHLQRSAGFVRVAFRLAFWHALHTRSWRDAVVDVASRGGDADTNAAIVGALLGARDGESAIPAAWRECVLGAAQPGPAEWADAHHPRHLLALVRE